MIAGQNNIPKLRFPEFSDAWEVKKLGEVFKIFNGYAFSSNESVEDGVLWVKIADVGIQEMKRDNLSFLPKDFSKKYTKFLLKKGDFIVALTRPILNGKLKIAEINDFFDGSLLNQRVGKIESNNSKGFIYRYLQKDDLIKSIENNISRSAPPNLSPNEINYIELLIPTIPEQQKIATFLSTVDEKLQVLKKKKSLLETYKKGLMQKLFSQEIRFKDDKGNNFKGWEVKKLGEVAKITTGSSNREDSNLDGEFTFFDRSQDIRSSNRFLFDAEAIIVPGEGQEFIPKYFKGKFDLHQRTYAIMDFKNINGIFLFYSISFNTNHLNSHAVGSTVKSLRLPMFETMPVNLPTLPEQIKIANFLTAIDEKINRVDTQIKQTELWKKGLLQQMFC